jgi:hypothetical protein
MDIQMDLMIGIGGMALILLAFLFNQVNLWKNDDLVYDMTNFLGSVALIYYAWVGNVIPFIILNVVWAFFSLKDVFFDVNEIRKGKKKFHFYHLSK